MNNKLKKIENIIKDIEFTEDYTRECLLMELGYMVYRDNEDAKEAWYEHFKDFFTDDYYE